ncbi:hypothetical protein A2433_01105 [Candidatus Giovannonibacteria bacterium RIFOXYC1_FULL_48_8]|nr:MAG: hypothetical protein A2433_01105 [Candidatus Giovannonibacteria bacterium RIFOXYC1_FULL_48_8]
MSSEWPHTKEDIETKFKDSKVRSPEGALLKVYHYSDESIESFTLDHVGKNFNGDRGFFGAGIYFTEADDAFHYGQKQYAAYLNLKNPLIIKNPSVEDIQNTHGKKQEFLEQGYDGVMVWNDAIPEEEKIMFGKPTIIKGREAGWSEICVFNPEDIYKLV